MVKPPSILKPGARIGVVAPAGIYDSNKLQEAISLVEGWGYSVVRGPNLGKTHRYMAGTDSERCSDLQWGLRSTEIDAVWMARGGYGINRILAGLDLGGLDSRPVIGFSDVTSLLVALRQQGGQAGIHGPVLHSLSHHPSQESVLHLKKLLEGQTDFDLPGEAWRVGESRAPVVGGNLCMLASLCGTPWQLNAEGCILVLEEVGEAPYRVDRMLQQLKSSGVFRGIQGLAVGSFEGFAVPGGAGWSLSDLLCEAVDVPIVGGLPIGHGRENRAFIFGAEGCIDGDRLVFESSPQ